MSLNQILRAASPGRVIELSGLGAPRGKKIITLTAVATSMALTVAGILVHWLIYLNYFRDLEVGITPGDPRRVIILVLDSIGLLVTFAMIVRLLSGTQKTKNPAIDTFLSAGILALLVIRWSYVLDPNPDPADPRRDFSITLSVLSLSAQAFLLLIMILTFVGIITIPANKLFS